MRPSEKEDPVSVSAKFPRAYAGPAYTVATRVAGEPTAQADAALG